MHTPTYAEEAVLGGILLRNENFHDAAGLLSAEHFTTALHKRLWSALRDRILAGEPADSVTVMELLPEDAVAILDIANTCITSRSVPTYVAIVRENWRRREASSIAHRLQTAMRDGESGAIDEAIGALLNLNAAQTECEFTGKQALQMAWAAVDAAHKNGGRLPGITTGLQCMDDILGGWHNSDLTLIGARPAVGKTAFLLNLAEASADAGFMTGIISAEQPTLQLGMRRLALASDVGAQNLRNGKISEDEWGRLTSGLIEVRDRNMRIYDRSAVTLDELRAVARKWKHSHDLRILFIDYAQRITVPGADRITEVSTIARGLKNMARDLQIPVIALAQVKQEVDKRDNKRPMQGDLANSDELAREADSIITLYRAEAYEAHGVVIAEDERGTAEVLIEKNRHGPTGFKRVAFHGPTMRFADLERRGF